MLILFVALSGCAGKDPEKDTIIVNATPIPAQATVKAFAVPEHLTVYVTIMGTMFNPPVLEIPSGTTVKWTNQDSGQYKVNVSGSHSPIMNKRDSWSFTFNSTGLYEYGCDIHPSMPHGRIIVI